jgi:hypothetical protein
MDEKRILQLSEKANDDSLNSLFFVRTPRSDESEKTLDVSDTWGKDKFFSLICQKGPIFVMILRPVRGSSIAV